MLHETHHCCTPVSREKINITQEEEERRTQEKKREEEVNKMPLLLKDGGQMPGIVDPKTAGQDMNISCINSILQMINSIPEVSNLFIQQKYQVKGVVAEVCDEIHKIFTTVGLADATTLREQLAAYAADTNWSLFYKQFQNLELVFFREFYEMIATELLYCSAAVRQTWARFTANGNNFNFIDIEEGYRKDQCSKVSSYLEKKFSPETQRFPDYMMIKTPLTSQGTKPPLFPESVLNLWGSERYQLTCVIDKDRLTGRYAAAVVHNGAWVKQARDKLQLEVLTGSEVKTGKNYLYLYRRSSCASLLDLVEPRFVLVQELVHNNHLCPVPGCPTDRKFTCQRMLDLHVSKEHKKCATCNKQFLMEWLFKVHKCKGVTDSDGGDSGLESLDGNEASPESRKRRISSVSNLDQTSLPEPSYTQEAQDCMSKRCKVLGESHDSLSENPPPPERRELKFPTNSATSSTTSSSPPLERREPHSQSDNIPTTTIPSLPPPERSELKTPRDNIPCSSSPSSPPSQRREQEITSESILSSPSSPPLVRRDPEISRDDILSSPSSPPPNRRKPEISRDNIPQSSSPSPPPPMRREPQPCQNNGCKLVGDHWCISPPVQEAENGWLTASGIILREKCYISGRKFYVPFINSFMRGTGCMFFFKDGTNCIKIESCTMTSRKYEYSLSIQHGGMSSNIHGVVGEKRTVALFGVTSPELYYDLKVKICESLDNIWSDI